MEKQRLGAAPEKGDRRPTSPLLPKLAVGLIAILLTAYMAREMYFVLAVAGMIALEWALLVLFTVNLAWIAFAFGSATIGLFHSLRPRRTEDRTGRTPRTRTAILFPVYNEDPAAVLGTVEAVARDLATAAPGAFECFVLSDTNRPDAALLEEAAFQALRDRAPADCPVFYRRRTINHERKSGNIEDFVSRWGGRYDHMIVFDADSFMQTGTILELVYRMEDAPDAGLIQTIPQLVRGETLFARAQQFAGALYGPVLGAGVAWWSRNEGNFWGHNAIIRVPAFAEAAALPALPGKAPFGGPVLSHDFIEAALLRKAGWKVVIADDLSGSYEECPPSIVDLTIRDRRWCQGNLQHMAVLLRTRGMTWTNRLHLGIGIMSYLAAPLWLTLILVGMALSLQAQFLRPEYFGDGVSLFPRWPVTDSARALSLFVLTMAVLFAPKVYGLVYGLLQAEWRKRVGPVRVVASVLVETVLSVLIAPILLVSQSGSVISILLGRDAGWAPQQRAGGYPFTVVLRRHFRTMVLGALLTGAAFAISPVFCAWLAPASAGMILAPWLAHLTGSSRAGLALKRAGLLLTPAEVDPPRSVTASVAAREGYGALEIQTLDTLFARGSARRRRADLVDPHWSLGEGAVHVPLATALAKARRHGAELQLAPAEAMALLNDSGALDEAAEHVRPAAPVLKAV